METVLFPLSIYIYSLNNHCYSAGHGAAPFEEVLQGSKLDWVSAWALGMEKVALDPGFVASKPQILRQITSLSSQVHFPHL